MHFENQTSPLPVGGLDGHAAIEPPRPQQCLVEHIDPIRRADNNHVRGRVEAIHLGQDLIESLLTLVAAAKAAPRTAARPADRVQLVDEDDGR